MLRQIRQRWGRRARRRARWRRTGGGRLLLWPLAQRALLARWRPPERVMALLLLTPPLTGLGEVAPGAAGKAHEAAGGQGHPQAALVVGAVEGLSRCIGEILYASVTRFMEAKSRPSLPFSLSRYVVSAARLPRAT